MKGILLDIKNNEVRTVEANGLYDYYEMLNCDTIDIVRRRIGRRWYEIICDDEGLMKSDIKISAIGNLGNTMLVGSLLICGLVDEEGELTDLTDADIKYIKERILTMATRKYPDGYLMLTQCEY